MTLRDLLVVSALWVFVVALLLVVLKFWLRHHLERLDTIAESLDSAVLLLRGKVEGMDARIVETRQEQMRQAEAVGGLRASVDMLLSSHRPGHDMGGG